MANHDLVELLGQVDEMVETVVSDQNLEEATLRRVLRFLSQMIQVVEQSFQDVLTLLFEIKFLEVSDLNSPKMHELHKQLELLTARSYYRDAAEVCSRLKHLRENFDEFIRPSVQHLQKFSGWDGVLGLIEHREGRIIMLIEDAARRISRLLDTIDDTSLTEVKQLASQNADELRALLSDLHDLNAQILGFSGNTGFIELTRDRTQLQREVKIMIDKRDQSIIHGHKVTFGNNNTVHGSVVVAESVQNSFNQAIASGASPEIKTMLSTLHSQFEQLLPMLPTDKRAEVEKDLSTFVDEVTKESPRKRWYELSADGLVEAAKTCAELAPSVISTVKRIVGLL